MQRPRIAATFLAFVTSLLGAACTPIERSAAPSTTPDVIVLRIDGSDYPPEVVEDTSLPPPKPTPRSHGLLTLTRQPGGVAWEIAEMGDPDSTIQTIRSGTLRGASWDALLTELNAMPNAAHPPGAGFDPPPEFVSLTHVTGENERPLLETSDAYQMSILLHAYPTTLSIVNECMGISKGYWFRFVSPHTWGPGSETFRHEKLITDHN